MEAMEIEAIKDDTPRPRFFLPADAAAAFRADFLEEEASRRWILAMIHVAGPITCPDCRAPLTEIALQRFWKGGRICCRACGKYFTALTGTFLAGCHMDFREILLLALFLHFNISAREIARVLKISAETVRLWEIKFQALKRIQEMEAPRE